MNYLFDISPVEVPDKKKARKKAAPRAAPAPAVVEPLRRRYGEAILGRSEGHYHCADESCQSTQFDIIDDWKGEWLVECMICGVGQRVPAVPGVLKASGDTGEFVFSDGKFEGERLSDVAEDPQGIVYITWAAKSHKREAVRVACKKWIDSLPASE